MTKRAWTIVVAAAVVLVLLVAWEVIGSRPRPTAKVGAMTPEITGQTVNGQAFHLTSLRGEPVFLDFFATWCPPCQQETPVLNAFARDTQGKVRVVLIDRNDSKALIRQFVTKYHLSKAITVLYNHPDVLSQVFAVTGQPEGIFINADGVITSHTEGPLTTKQLAQLARQAGMR